MAVRKRAVRLPSSKPRPAKAQLPDFYLLEQRIAELSRRIEQLASESHVHFQRIAQLQADIDLIRAAWAHQNRK